MHEHSSDWPVFHEIDFDPPEPVLFSQVNNPADWPTDRWLVDDPRLETDLSKFRPLPPIPADQIAVVERMMGLRSTDRFEHGAGI